MKRTVLIAALVSLIPLAAAGTSVSAESYHGYGGRSPHWRGISPTMPYFHKPRPRFERYHFRRDWHPRPHWRMPHMWR